MSYNFADGVGCGKAGGSAGAVVDVLAGGAVATALGAPREDDPQPATETMSSVATISANAARILSTAEVYPSA